ncbi:MAG TPA: histidine kinase [Edaphocola sp.]|nr:histidine kinase [Edaphocola sp.]
MTTWNNIWRKSFTERYYRWGLHIVFWILYFLAFSFWDYFLLSLTGWTGRGLIVAFWVSMTLNIIVVVVSAYLTLFTAYRFLVKRQKYLWFFLTLALDVLVFCFFLAMGQVLTMWILPHLGVKDCPKLDSKISELGRGAWGIVQMVLSYFALLCLPVAAKFFRDQMRLQYRKNDLEQQNMQLQMDFLKAQIHPHFLFNTLNNIYALTTNMESAKASEVVFGLSSLLRYALYEGRSELISLQKEVSMLQHFIDLEVIRSDDLQLTVDLPEQIDEYIKLPPFLLLPLVENAFKHGVNSQFSLSNVQIKLAVKADQIELTVSNNFDRDYRLHNEGGIGLANLRKRLDYYYAKNYTFETKEIGNQFIAHLILPVSCPKSNA